MSRIFDHPLLMIWIFISVSFIVGLLVYLAVGPSVDADGYDTNGWHETKSPNGNCYEVYRIGGIDFEMFEVPCDTNNR